MSKDQRNNPSWFLAQVELLKLEYTIEREFFYDGEDKSKIKDIFKRLKEMQK